MATFVSLSDGSQVSNDLNVSVSIPSTIDTIDLSKPSTNSDPSIWGHIAKNGTGYEDTPPILNDGSIFATDSSLYLFSGAINQAPGGPTRPPANDIWQYQFGKQQWTRAAITGAETIRRPHWGTSVQGVDKAVGYYLGGAIAPKSDISFNALYLATPCLMQGLLTFDETRASITNSSITVLNQDGTVLGGFMTFIETLGSEGVFIAFRGITNMPGVPTKLGYPEFGDPTMHSQLYDMSVYDISAQRWFQ